MNILSNVVDDGGCGYYRVRWPLEAIKRKNLAQTLILDRGWTGEQILSNIKNADVILFRPRTERLLYKLKEYETTEPESYKKLRLGEKLYVLDQDDNTFEISPLNDHYKELGTEEVEAVNPKTGKKEWLWKDGVDGFDLQNNRYWQNSLTKTMKDVDLITTTTPKMAEFLRQFNKKVAVIPNAIDFTKYSLIDIRKTDEIRIGWQGGASHFEDWAEVAPAIVEIMNKYPKAKLVIYGSWWDGPLKSIPEHRIEKHGWVKTAGHPYKEATLNLDIGIIPIKDNTFNQYKSEVKFSEFAALKFPSVVRNLTPYKEVCKDGENALCYNNNRELVEKVSLLIEKPELRKKIAENAYEWVRRERDLDKIARLWVSTYDKALPW